MTTNNDDNIPNTTESHNHDYYKVYGTLVGSRDLVNANLFDKINDTINLNDHE